MMTPALVSCVGLVLLLLATALGSEHATKGSKPNVVIFFVDDFGYGDVGSFYSKFDDTPNIDSMLAAKGLRLTDFHAMSLCTPSRASLLTGRLGLRTGVVNNFSPLSVYGMSLNETTVASLLQPTYATAMTGKWHLGIQPDYHPMSRGFDRFLGLATSHDYGCTNADFWTKAATKCPSYQYDKCSEYGNPRADPASSNCPISPTNPWKESVPIFLALCVDRDILAQPVDLQTLTEQYADFAIDFINEAVANDTKPFFLYQAFNHMHAPVTANPLFNGTSKSTDTYEHGPMYGDALRELDYHIGRVVDTIDSLGIRNNTIIFFTGDNGGPSAECELGGSNGIFNGTWLRTVAGGGATGKATTWEGGHREASIVSWPGKIQEGRVSSALTSTLDYLPTILSLAGVEPAKDRFLDGLDMAPVLFDGNDTLHEFLMHPTYGEGGPSGHIETVRLGAYKAKWRIHKFGGCAAWPPSQHGSTHKSQHLAMPLIFNLESDPSESSPLDQNSTRYQQVYAAIEETRQQFAVTVENDVISKTDYTEDKTCTPEKCIKPCCNISTPLCTCT